jgi:ketosteroid isomerase-like protein
MMASPGFALSWQASKVEASRGGDLAYSVGTYELTMNDPKGKPVTDRGKYMTVWKKQPDGQWKVVTDMYNSDLPAPEAGKH